MSEHRIFFIFDLCHAIAWLDTFLMSLPAAPTPTWVGSGGEEGDTDGFWTPEIGAGMLVSIELHDRSFINAFSGFRWFAGGWV